MPKKKLSKSKWFILTALLVVAALTLTLTVNLGEQVKKASYDTAVLAAEKMQACMDEIKAEKQRRGIEIVKEDTFETGMLGEDSNWITTTSGDLQAKRTTADANMAAMLVFMLEETGVKAGDNVGCNFSGSFPSLNIATICACEAIGATPVYISSCGSSTWGSNNPELCFPEMADVLLKAGLISEGPVLVTPGGAADVGRDMDEEIFSEVWERVEALGYKTMINDDFESNVSARKAVLDEYDISCFVAVGGNITSMGYGDVIYLLGQGIIHEEITSLNSDSGLIEDYLYEGTPAIFLLNIKKLVADYGLPFDPASHQEIGTASMYYETSYPKWILITGLAIEACLLATYYFCDKKEKKTKAKLSSFFMHTAKRAREGQCPDEGQKLGVNSSITWTI